MRGHGPLSQAEWAQLEAELRRPRWPLIALTTVAVAVVLVALF